MRNRFEMIKPIPKMGDFHHPSMNLGLRGADDPEKEENLAEKEITWILITHHSLLVAHLWRNDHGAGFSEMALLFSIPGRHF